MPIYYCARDYKSKAYIDIFLNVEKAHFSIPSDYVPRSSFIMEKRNSRYNMLSQMRDLQHDNVNGFVGACIEPPNVCALSEYCTRGSLKVIIVI